MSADSNERLDEETEALLDVLIRWGRHDGVRGYSDRHGRIFSDLTRDALMLVRSRIRTLIEEARAEGASRESPNWNPVASRALRERNYERINDPRKSDVR